MFGIGLDQFRDSRRYGTLLILVGLVVLGIPVLQPGIPSITTVGILSRIRVPSLKVYGPVVLILNCAWGIFSEYRRDVETTSRLRKLAQGIRHFELESKANPAPMRHRFARDSGEILAAMGEQARYAEAKQAQYLLRFQSELDWALAETNRRDLIEPKSATESLLKPKNFDNAARFLDNLAALVWRPKKWLRVSLFRTIAVGIFFSMSLWLVWKYLSLSNI
jgi:hypothetical protein